MRESSPPFELPKEVWERLRRDKDIAPDDLPQGVSVTEIERMRREYYAAPSRLVLDVLCDPEIPYSIVLSDPGAGKSTLARYVLLSLIDPTAESRLRPHFDGYLPLLIELRNYEGIRSEKLCNTFLEFIEYLGKTEGWHLTEKSAQRLSDQGWSSDGNL